MERPALTTLGEDESLFRATVRAFADERLRPLVAEMDREAKLHPEVIAWLFELGLMGIEVPESWGGAGASFFMSILAIEELARVDPSVAVVCDVQNTLVVNAVRKFGTPDQQERLLGKLAGGTVGAYALSEAGSGSDAFALACRAEARGDDFELRGRKLWITNGDEAGLFLVFATVDPSAGYKGITCFAIERDAPGFSIGRKEDKLGIRASSTCELIFDGVSVPRENVIGAVGKGYKVAIETLNEGRIGIAAQMVGLAQGAYEGALALRAGARAVRPEDRRVPGRATSPRARRDRHRSSAAAHLQRGASPRRGPALRARSRDGEVVRQRRRRARRVRESRALRWHRLHEGMPRREVPARREDRKDLRRHFLRPTRHHRQVAVLKVYLLDSHVYVFRAYHALPPMHTPDGVPCHAAYGFASTLRADADAVASHALRMRLRRGDDQLPQCTRARLQGRAHAKHPRISSRSSSSARRSRGRSACRRSRWRTSRPTT